jgi:DNA (cytosine-5)-methyltransferase 1
LAANEGEHVAWAIEGRNQVISREVHHSLRGGRDSGDAVVVGSSEVAGTLTASRGTGFRSNGTPIEGVAITPMGPRRFTPREYERLQGFPDDFTLVPFRGKPAKDSPRFKALGNSMPVPVMWWIGRRIAAAFTPFLSGVNGRRTPDPTFPRSKAGNPANRKEMTR